MPNIKSAEKRMRNSAKKQANNHAKKSRLKTLEKSLNAAIAAGDDAKTSDALKAAVSAFDKAAKTRTIHPDKAERKKSRLMKRVASAKAA